MNGKALFDQYFSQCPLVGIIRGVTPAEAPGIAQALFDGGIRIIEVPLNSPDPFDSIGAIAKLFGDEALVGAGTVIDLQHVERVKEAGGRLIVSPNTNPRVISAAVATGLASLPGFFTPTEAFNALGCGASALKLFPAEAASPKVVKSLRAVLPKDVRLLMVGGIEPGGLGEWMGAGANGFGLGGGLYKPGQSAAETLRKARAYVEALEL